MPLPHKAIEIRSLVVHVQIYGVVLPGNDLASLKYLSGRVSEMPFILTLENYPLLLLPDKYPIGCSIG